MVKLRFRLDRVSYREAISTLLGVLENGSDLHVNKRQKIDTIVVILLKNKKKECQIPIFNFDSVRSVR